ncbi:DNA repair metallo-beta-lactamase [Artemisia annua]|uniref:DNA repair metallo-beta-lactamase n=1 Tax=Artemisia annua TaxID=35608 RepID=A0A2U1NFQ4_ARTAN|nr:DNA repair metallo-beta-lactamase [Artemisia annua]
MSQETYATCLSPFKFLQESHTGAIMMTSVPRRLGRLVFVWDTCRHLKGNHPSKKPKKTHIYPGKENRKNGEKVESFGNDEVKGGLGNGFGYLSNSIESRLLFRGRQGGVCDNVEDEEEDGGMTQLDVLLDLCGGMEGEEEVGTGGDAGGVSCPICGGDISEMSDELRQVHTNECLDEEMARDNVDISDDEPVSECPGLVLDGLSSGASVIDDPSSGASGQVLDDPPCQANGQLPQVSPVLEWLRNLGLSRYEEVFIREEVDWDSLRWLTDEDLCNIGITALGPRKKIVHALSELRSQGSEEVNIPEKVEVNIPEKVAHKETKIVSNKLITDFFPGFAGKVKKPCTTGAQVGKTNSNSGNKRNAVKTNFSNKKFRDIPSWCSIDGTPTPFRVDAFKYLRRDCFHWFLTHFHADHYGGLTKSFCHGKIYCSLITAKLVNFKIGIPWEKIEVLPLNQKIVINGVDVTCFDANHCPGAIIILFELPNGKAILHTGDFRYCEDMKKISSLQTRVQTLILDTTYCDPQYDFPKQEAVIQYVLEAIQAEAFNPRTLFLIGSYTIGKERLFMEVARVLQKKIYVTAAKMRVLECLGMPKEDMQWLTLDERESHIHVVPMWTLASFKRLKHVSNMYSYDFPKQEAVIQYVLEAIQAEAFNPRTLFLIGSYTIGKERLFMEVARVLQKKIYVTAAKMRVLECLGMPKEDMQWLTLDERESHIHVVPMWTLASFKRLKHVSNMYSGRYSLIVAFSPTGWSFGKGKKSSPGKRWQQGTIIRYEVPYSEHSSFTELKEFVKFVSPETIIPSVNNHGLESTNKMVSILSS